jgi:hypothetical protein
MAQYSKQEWYKRIKRAFHYETRDVHDIYIQQNKARRYLYGDIFEIAVSFEAKCV